MQVYLVLGEDFRQLHLPPRSQATAILHPADLQAARAIAVPSRLMAAKKTIHGTQESRLSQLMLHGLTPITELPHRLQQLLQGGRQMSFAQSQCLSRKMLLGWNSNSVLGELGGGLLASTSANANEPAHNCVENR